MFNHRAKTKERQYNKGRLLEVVRRKPGYKVYYSSVEANCSVVVIAIIPPLPTNGGTARTAIQIRVVNLIEIRLGKRWQPISNQSCVTVSPTTNKAECHWWVPKNRLLQQAGLAISHL